MMNENRYTRAVDGIKAPEASVQKMLDTIRSFEQKEKIVYMRSIRKTIIAASLVIAITLGAILGVSMLSPKDNPFTLSVNAAEMTEQAFTPIGTLNSIGGDWTTDDKTDRVVMREFFEFNVSIEGENIDSVVYTVDDGHFGYSDETCESLSRLYQSDVVSEEQDEKTYTCLWLSGDSWDSTLPEAARQAIRDWNDHANVKLDQPTVQPDYDDRGFDIADCTKTIYSALLDRLSVDVEITFTDGRTVSKTLIFTCDSVEQETGIAHISAKLQ